MKTYSHRALCPNYVLTANPAECTCEASWVAEDEIQGLEKIQEYLTELFMNSRTPTLFQWAEIVNGFEGEETEYDPDDAHD